MFSLEKASCGKRLLVLICFLVSKAQAFFLCIFFAVKGFGCTFCLGVKGLILVLKKAFLLAKGSWC